jgi:hypothetical protein
MRPCRGSPLEGATSLADVDSNVCSKVRLCRGSPLEGATTLAARTCAHKKQKDLKLSKETYYSALKETYYCLTFLRPILSKEASFCQKRPATLHKKRPTTLSYYSETYSVKRDLNHRLLSKETYYSA